MIEEGRALFLQIAESIEDQIVDGSLAEESQAPSTNELAAFYRINPATAAKGVSMLVDQGVLYKRRGIGMFVAAGSDSAPMTSSRSSVSAPATPLPFLPKGPCHEPRDRGAEPHQAIP